MAHRQRYTVLDSLRGGTVLCMVLYHALWDLVNIFHVQIPWFSSGAAYVWQQTIRWTFILLSGFCWSFGHKKIKRALTVLLCSVVVSVVSIVFMPEGKILFGVLSLIGTGMVVMIPLDKITKKGSPYLGLVVCGLLFAVTRHVQTGTLGIGEWEPIKLPSALYANYVTAYLGFPPESFCSSDYVPLVPWLFLYGMGYFIYLICEKNHSLSCLSAFRAKPLEWLGRHSLIIYMLHQPIVYGVLYVALM